MLKKDLTKIYDAHTHFNDSWYQEENISINQIIVDAELANVGYFNDVAFDLPSSRKAIQQSEDYDNVFAVIGIHPNEVSRHKLEDLKTLEELAKNKKVVAIGEVGIDYFYSKDDAIVQKKWFQHMITLAQKTNLPLMMHIRDDNGCFHAYDEVLEIISNQVIKNKVVHCFSANTEYAQKFLDQGCYLEIGGAVTFKNAKQLQEAIKIIPLERMLVETDAPYLTPHPFRGEMNFSKYINLTIEKIAEIKNVSKKEVIQKTTQNAFKIFLE